MKDQFRELLGYFIPVPVFATNSDMDIIKQAAIMCGAKIVWEDQYDFRNFSNFYISHVTGELHGGTCRSGRSARASDRWLEALSMARQIVVPFGRKVGGI